MPLGSAKACPRAGNQAPWRRVSRFVHTFHCRVPSSRTQGPRGRATAAALVCASLLAPTGLLAATSAQVAGAAPGATGGTGVTAASATGATPTSAIATTIAAPGMSTSTPAPAAVAVPWWGANCPKLAGTATLEGDITQSMNGALTGCLRVPVVPPGDYYVSLQDVLEGATAPRGPTTSVAAPAEPPVTLSVSPARAAPGESVRLTGKLASPLAPRPGYGNFCWDGCSGGLVYDGVQLAWQSATVFTAQLTLPDAPWVEQTGPGPDARLPRGRHLPSGARVPGGRQGVRSRRP